jgi:dienelactone hydrolase
VATRLAREGVSSLLPCYPVYGERRPASQTQHLVATVAELGIASTAAAMEGASLVSWAAAEFPGVRICITGMSMGGAGPAALLRPTLTHLCVEPGPTSRLCV